MRRPTSVMVLGILNLLLGVFGLLGTVVSLAMIIHPQPQVGVQNPVLELAQQNPNFAQYMRVILSVGLVACIVLFVAGFGLLLLKPWGRLLSIGYAAYAIVAAIVNTAITYSYMMPLLEKASQMPVGPQKGAIIGGVVGGILGNCVGVLYPLILLFFMFRPNVVAAMQSPCTAEIVEDF